MKKWRYQALLAATLLALAVFGATMTALGSAAGLTGMVQAKPPADQRDLTSSGSPWMTSTVDLVSPCMYQDVGLAFDTLGQPHLSYRGRHYLTYATLEDGNWITQTVDDGTPGAINAIALDSLARPHIVYVLYEPYMDSRLRYARWDGDQWLKETVSDESGVVHRTSLAIDSQDLVHIAFQRDSKTEYGQYPEPPEIIDSGAPGWGVSLALDDKDRPHVSYNSTAGLSYAWHDGTSWHIEDVERSTPALRTGYYSSLALDTANNPHVSYSRYNCDDWTCWAEQLGYATKMDGQWMTDTVIAKRDVGFGSSIAVAYYGLVRIAFPDSSSGQIMLAAGNYMDWRLEQVDSAKEIRRWSSISMKLDPGTGPGIAYCTSDEIKFAHLPLNVYRRAFLPLIQR